ncbi:MAG: succinate dehydrogenase membrane anchor subunit [Lysobacteraceae bacterium]|nr:MAG: succinate dehydrogenase membrane anchor subunit [Xanthomonadaceae bacterium]
MSLRTPLGKAIGLGSAQSGAHHWWMQRVTAVALIPLALWFVWSLMSLLGADQATVQAWISQPLNAAMLMALVIAMFYHAQLGLQVVIEDYVHTGWLEISLQILVKFAAIIGALICTFAIVSVF